MTNATTQAIAAESQRRRIPSEWLIEFESMTNEELAWFASTALKDVTRAYCGWELEYREAFGIDVTMGDNGELKRVKG